MWTPQKPVINLQMLVFHRSQRLAAFMVQWQGKHFIHCVQTMTPMLTQRSSKTIAFGFIHWVILGRELGSHGLWTRMIKDHSNAWRGCTAKPRSIQSYRLGELGKGIQGNRQGERTIHLRTVTSRENLLEDVTWCRASPTLSTAHRDPLRTECHAQSPLGHCFPALSVHLLSGVQTSCSPSSSDSSGLTFCLFLQVSPWFL